ncbi:hypothetical protein F5876DRAFT_87104 [Lentinula aff. lateritia]|uniref:Uncharacterized protein n=1 Tax=Lentinula aff. lateritia TaxID=2804960 RepID=A0ACC1U977_9AGAR|nr:hypothetical protein F5876DRAFT_87104 [Lentinula aff. lateritia]
MIDIQQYDGPPPLPRPPAMQFPNPAVDVSAPSLTMQYAQQQPPPPQQILNPYGGGLTGYGTPPARPYSAPAPPGFPHPASSPYPSPYPSPSPSGAPPLPSSPTRPVLNTQFNSPSAGLKQQGAPGRRRASSTPPTPTAGVTGVSGHIQCSGVTKAGKRCTRLVKGGPALVNVWGANSPTSGDVERFCHQHAKELLGPSGFYARKQHRDGRQGQGLQEWIDFNDYIPPYLHPDTQVALRVEMEKPRSQSDVEGYIYTFEIRGEAHPNDPSPPTISLKVGRAVNVVKRLNQWGKQCGSKEQVLRGWYPGEVDNDSEEANDTVGQSLMKGRVKAGGRGVWCHRLERLIHLELADLAVHGPYLQPGWETFSKGSGRAKSKSPPKNKKDRFLANGLGNGGGGAPCKDCGQIHKEIFEFMRIVDYHGMEWEGIVKKVIDEWGFFVENYV